MVDYVFHESRSIGRTGYWLPKWYLDGNGANLPKGHVSGIECIRSDFAALTRFCPCRILPCGLELPKFQMISVCSGRGF